MQLGTNFAHHIFAQKLEINFPIRENLDKSFGKFSFFLETHTTFLLPTRCDHRSSRSSYVYGMNAPKGQSHMTNGIFAKMAAENCHSVNSFSIQTGVLIETVNVFFVENLDSHAKCCTIVMNIESSFEESRASRAVISHAQHVPHANLNSIAQQKPFCLLCIICNEGCLCGQSISVREICYKSDIHTCS